MPRARHRRVKAKSRLGRVVTVGLAAAVLAAVPVGLVAWPDNVDGPSDLPQVMSLGQLQREVPTSRGSVERSPIPEPTVTLTTPEPTDTPEPEPTVVGQMYVTTALNVRARPDTDAEVLTVLARGAKVDVTDVTDGAWVQIIHDDTPAWVNGGYLSETEPPEETSPPAESQPAQDHGSGGGISYAECPTGSAVEAGLTPDAIRVHRAVCAQFPQVTTYLGVRSGGGAHSEGRALDIMVGSDSALGDAIAAWVREHHKVLGVSEVIWAQRIWTVQRSSEGWRWMEDRGSPTANHYDHVHVTVYGNAGG